MTRLTATRRKESTRNTQDARTQRIPSAPMLPIPVGGLDAISPITNMPPGSALAMDNWFPQLRYIEVRRGNVQHSDTAVGDFPVETLAPYSAANVINDKLFAATGGAIWDVTTSTPSEVVPAQISDRWQYVNFSTAAAQFLFMVNGADPAIHWNGTVWANPAITGVDPATLVNVAVFKSRLWFCQSESIDAWYMPADLVAGAATRFRLGGVFNEGGYLQAVATWSIEGGDGPDDRIAFLSSRGEIAVYQGTDPTSSATFALVGVYKIGAPIGRRCALKVGGEVAVICDDGVIPMSKAMVIDRGEATSVALTANIQPLINDVVRRHRSKFGWQMVLYPRGTRAILNVPLLENESQYQYVINTISGAWCRFIGMHANCWAVFQDRLFFGGNDGTVYEADSGGTDDGETIVANLESAFTDAGSPMLKQFHLVRPFINADGGDIVAPAIAINVDFRQSGILNATESAIPFVAQWDEALWDQDVWPAEERLVADWQGVAAITGNTVSVRLQVSQQSEGGAEFTLQLLAMQIAYTTGGIL